MTNMTNKLNSKQRGGTMLGLVIGALVGLGAALAVAVYVTKVPVPFLNKAPMLLKQPKTRAGTPTRRWLAKSRRKLQCLHQLPHRPVW
jgi:cell division protein FtsN